MKGEHVIVGERGVQREPLTEGECRAFVDAVAEAFGISENPAELERFRAMWGY